MPEQLGDGPIQQEYKDKMNMLARDLDRVFNGDKHGQDRATGFVLMVFPFGDTNSGRCNYISNGANRDDVVALMREMIQRFTGGQPEVSGKA